MHGQISSFREFVSLHVPLQVCPSQSPTVFLIKPTALLSPSLPPTTVPKPNAPPSRLPTPVSVEWSEGVIEGRQPSPVSTILIFLGSHDGERLN
ncbi:hypothetical protein CRG98_015815 [Punica granatum]|uniref:Uncharacterized protein n=1 Tax=Punica granatum TaxID=22663 RepID=A0A2I0K5M8_PUNGR|nr:hypothetical protein CRG98_015815 [Punica granatum]